MEAPYRRNDLQRSLNALLGTALGKVPRECGVP